MLLRPSPGRLRTVLRSVGQARVRPRPPSAIVPSPRAIVHPRLRPASSTAYLSHPAALRAVSRRCFSSSSRSSARSAAFRPIASPSALLRSALRAARALRAGFARTSAQLRAWSPRRLLVAIRIAPYELRSSLLRGALDVFRAPGAQPSAARAAYARMTSPSVAFARGGLSGLGARPVGGQLALSPLRGGVGMQTARKFSSGGACVFDHLVVNAPLALRLAADELDDKAKLALRRPAASAARPNPRRTGATFSAAKLARNAAAFASAPRAEPTERSKVDVDVHVEASSVVSSCVDVEAQLSTYFELPAPSVGLGGEATVVTMRLIDPLFDVLGGREPASGDEGRLFDAALLRDASTALAYEHARYLRAKSVLRVLWDAGLLADDAQMDLESDPALWTVTLPRVRAERVSRLLEHQLEFEFDQWCSVHAAAEQGAVGLDLSQVWPLTPPVLSSSGWHSTDEDSQSWEQSEEQAEGFEMLSLPDSPPLSSGQSESVGSLFDSRTQW